MADITRPTATLGQASTQRTVSQIHPANQDFLSISGKVAGEVLASGQPVYIHTDDKVYKADANAAADDLVHGIVVKDVLAADQPVTLLTFGVMGGYTGLTIGTMYFVSNTEGEIADAAGTAYLPVGIAVAANRILFFPILSGVFGAVHAAGIAAP